MNVNARKVHRTVVGIGLACAVAAALPCVAAEASPVADTVTVEAKNIRPDQPKKPSKSAPAEQNIGFISGLAIGAVAGGPIGAVAGGITGALLGEHYHKQKALNKALAADLSGSNAERAKLTQTVMQLDGSLGHARDLTVNIAFRTGESKLTAQDIDQLATLGQLANAGLNQERIVIEALGADGDAAPGDLDAYAFQRRVSVKLMSGATEVEAKAGTTTVAQAQ